MTALIVTGCIVLFFAILLFSSVSVRFRYSKGKVSAGVRYLFLWMDFSPEKLAKRAEKKAAKEVKKEYEVQKAEEEAKPKKEKAALDTVKTVWSLIKASKKGLNTIRSHLIFYKINAAVAVGSEDAHKTATLYGLICTLTATGLSVLQTLFVVKKPKIVIKPCFTLESTNLDISFRVRIRPWFVLLGGMQVAISFIKTLNKNKRKRKKIKGGKQNEPTASYQ